MKAVVLLADSAEALPPGKVYALGLGWTQTFTPTPNMAVVAFIHVAWDEANQPFTFELTLMTADGQPVLVPSPVGPAPIKVTGQMEAGRPPGVPHGTDLTMPFAVNIGGGLPLLASQRYEWRLTINNGVTESAAFLVTGPAPVPPAPPVR